MKRSIYIIAFILSAIIVNAQTEGTFQLRLNYQYGVPLGSFKEDVVKNGSPRGFTGEVAYQFSDKVSLGLNVGYQDFYQKYDRAVYKINGQDVSAVLINSIQVTPIMLNGTFAFGNATSVRPYVHAGIGANMISNGQYLGQFDNTDATVKLAGQLGAGVNIPIGGNGTAINLGGTYYLMPYNEFGISNFNNLGLKAGVQFRLK